MNKSVLDDKIAEPVLLGTDLMSKLGPYLLDLERRVLRLRGENGQGLIDIPPSDSQQ